MNELEEKKNKRLQDAETIIKYIKGDDLLKEKVMSILLNRNSKSSLESFENCPHQFYLGKVFPEDFVEIEAMVRGTELHNLAEGLYSYEYSTKEDIREIMKNSVNGDKYPLQIEYFIKWLQKKELAKPFDYETKMFNEKIGISGQADRVDFINGIYELTDYKSGKEHPIDYYEFELMVYVMLYKLEKNIDIDYVRVYFFDTGKDIGMKVTQEVLMRTAAKINQLKSEMRDCIETRMFAPKKSWMCRFCQNRTKCQYV